MHEFHLAPLQGYTDKVYRKVFQTFFSGVDYLYTPYLSLSNDGEIQNVSDISGLEINSKNKTIPQLLFSNGDELIQLLQVVIDNEFERVNLNLGCPYPMVINKGRGASFIRRANELNEIVKYIYESTDLKLSIKIRSGIEEPNEVFGFLNNFHNEYVSSIILHPRTAKQLYKGEADLAIFTKCKHEFPGVDFIYNGDITNVAYFSECCKVIPDQKKWMIGRGVLANPFLIEDLTSGNSTEAEKQNRLRRFGTSLLQEIETDSSDKEHALNRIKTQFAVLFNSVKYKKMLKKIKKSGNMQDVYDSIDRFLV